MISKGRHASDVGPSILISHPTGNQNMRNAVQAFSERGILGEFWTGIAWNSGSVWNRLLPGRLRSQLERRSFHEAPHKKIHSTPFREMIRLAIRPTPLGRILSSEERAFSPIGIYRAFDRHVSQRLRASRVDMVYAYEGGALETFRQANKLGIKALYELPTAHWSWTRDLFEAEASRNPAYAQLMPQRQDSARHLAEKDEEIQRADLILVPSQHVRASLEGVVPDEKIRVVPYGAPAPLKRMSHDGGHDKPLRVLFAGTLFQRKGIGYLIEAVDRLGAKVDLTLVGRRVESHPQLDEACRRWRWIETLPHDELLDLMLLCDVLVLPSLSEAFGLVITEALACGLPVIVTPNVGGGDLIEDGREGFVVPICSASAIADRLEELYSDRNLLSRMSISAQQTAQYWPWGRYRAALIEAIETLPVTSETKSG